MPLARRFAISAAVVLAAITTASAVELSNAEVEDFVRRAYQYVAMYNVSNKLAIKQKGRNIVVDGRIAIYIAAEKPESVPDENWLPLNRGEYGIDVILRIYVRDLEKFKTWSPPKAEMFE